jgi:hypothetical protein
MRRIISLTILALTVTGGVAMADRHRGDRGDHRGDRGDHRSDRHDRGRWDRNRHSGGVVVRDHRGGRVAAPGWRAPRHHSYRRPVYVNNGYYQFHNGYRHAYSRPVIHHRYYNYRVRPQFIVENYQPMQGYIWVAGQWNWNGYEWMWTSGHYEIDPNYADDGTYYDNGTYSPQY